MKKLRIWLASESGKRFFNITYSLGAAIVIIGAMGKVMHFSWSSVVFVTGMVVEALIFILSAFDTSMYDNTPVTVARNVQMSDQIIANQAKSSATDGNVGTSSTVRTQSTGNADGGSQVYIVGGGAGTSTSNVSGSAVSGSVNVGGTISGQGQDTVFTGGTSVEGVNPESAKGYNESMASAAQNMEEFSKTMQSLNETSQALLGVYKQIADANSLTESMNTVRYINDSLARIKSQYDSAIGDSYMFKEEMAKMTRHIESLNQVYARLLQAMTSNNNPNNNNPSIY